MAKTDGALLKRFLARQDDAAFEAIMKRHGNMVLGVCQRVLGDRHDAEDASQATFLVLAHKAGSLRKQESLASWLHGVALRTALAARKSQARRRVREKRGAEMSQTAKADQAWHELSPYVDEEVEKLPQHYRAAVVLRYFEGKTNDASAQSLGWTEGTFRRRLGEARELLRKRLANRGVMLSAAIMAAGISQNAVAAELPAVWLAATAKAATATIMGKVGAAGVSAHVSTLVQETKTMLFWTQVKITASMVVAALMFVAGSVWAASAALSSPPEPTTPPREVVAPIKRTVPEPEEVPAASVRSVRKSSSGKAVWKGLPSNFGKKWDRFVILAWQFQTPAPNAQAVPLYKAAGIRGLHLDRSGTAALRDLVAKQKYYYYVDHAADKGYLHLRDKDKPKVSKKRNLVVRPNCFHQAATVTKMKDFLRKNVNATKFGKVVAYAFDDEISWGVFASPIEVCSCPDSMAAWRKWLKKRYTTIAKLNKTWGSHFGSFAAVKYTPVDKLRGNHKKPLNQWNIAPWFEHKAFMDESWAAMLEGLTYYVRTLDASGYAGFVGGGGPTAYGGYDYNLLSRSVNWIEAYDIGSSNEILRSFKAINPKLRHMQTYFPSGKATATWFLWYYLLHGNQGVIAWPKGWFPNRNSVSANIKALKSVHEEVQSDLSKPLVDAEFLDDKIALYYSHASIRTSWFMDIAPHGSTWPNRSSSLSNGSDTSHWNRNAWCKLLEDAGLQYNFVSNQQAVDGELLAKKYKVLILNRTINLSEAEAAAIKAFAKAGGTVIADQLTGIMNEYGVARKQALLEDLFGIKHNLGKGVMNGKGTFEVNGEKYNKPHAERLATMYDGAAKWQGKVVYERGLTATKGKATASAGGVPVVIEHKFGKGKAVYLNLATAGYVVDRTTSAGDSWRALITKLVTPAGIKRRVVVSVNGKADFLAETLFWKNGDRIYMGIIKNIMRGANINNMGKVGALPKSDTAANITIKFTNKVSDFRNERTKKKLGSGTSFKGKWVQYEGLLYSFKASKSF